MIKVGGPVPKRSDQRRRRNKPVTPITSAPGAASVPVPEADPGWSPPARRWYESLAVSGQSVWYQPSDWAQAAVLTEVLDRALAQGARPSARLIAVWAAGAAELLSSEGARRRVRVELERGQVDQDAESAVAALDVYRRRLNRDGPGTA